MSKPICACCGKPYGYRLVSFETMIVEIGKPIPNSLRNQPPIKEEFFPELPTPGEPDEPNGYVPMDENAYGTWPNGRINHLNYIGRKGRRVRRTFWNGESYGSHHDPFCTLRCAGDFARLAYEAGYRIVKGKTDD